MPVVADVAARRGTLTAVSDGPEGPAGQGRIGSVVVGKFLDRAVLKVPEPQGFLAAKAGHRAPDAEERRKARGQGHGDNGENAISTALTIDPDANSALRAATMLIRPERISRAAMAALLYFPSTELRETPRDAGLGFEELRFETDDGERLHGWWVPAQQGSSAGHILFFHGNAGNIGDRVAHAGLLARAGFDVLLFDYRGYGRSTGRPSEQGTYIDARAARRSMAAREHGDPAKVIYLGESLGAAVATELALSSPPRALILQSGFTSLRDVARRHYPLPRAVIPDAYPTIRRIGSVTTPVLVLHGDRDAIVPLSQGQRLFNAAPAPRQLHVFAGLGHNDLLSDGQYARLIADWVGDLDR